MPLGNDVVDLAETETELHALHPRFCARVLTAREARAVAASCEPRMALWARWAAKESAYKALRKVEASLAFSPPQFEVFLDDAESGPRAGGAVVYRGRRLALTVDCRAGRIHAVAGLGVDPSIAGVVVSAVLYCSRRQDASAEVREAALRGIAAALCPERRDLTIGGSRPPRLLCGGRESKIDVSLSHHGRWVAYAAAA